MQQRDGILVFSTILVVILLAAMPAIGIPDPTPLVGAKNPAAVYCESLGYEYHKEWTPRGMEGYCVLPDGTECPEWDFYRGLCGTEHSACANLGMETTPEKGPNGFSPSGGARCKQKRETTSKTLATRGGNPQDTGTPVGTLLGIPKKMVVASTTPEDPEDTRVKARVPTGSTSKPKKISTGMVAGQSAGSLPAFFDWRNVSGANWLTPIKNQGGCGSCWAFAAIGGVEAATKISRNDPYFDLDLAEEYLVSTCSSAGDCDGGWPDVALGFINDSGVPDEPCFPYTATDQECSNRCSTWDRRLWYITDYREVTVNTIDDIKQDLVEHGPLVAIMDISSIEFDENGIGRCPTTEGIDHAVVIVGYNDTGGYWIIRNSWGTGYQEGGYFKLGYGECYLDSGFWGPWVVIPEPTDYQKINSTSITTQNASITGDTSNLEKIDHDPLYLWPDCTGGDCTSSLTILGFDPSFTMTTSRVRLLVAHNSTRLGSVNISFNQTGSWTVLSELPNTSTYIQRFDLCNSIAECENLANNIDILVGYFTPEATGLAYNPFLAIDGAWLEVEPDPYCKAGTTRQNAWITNVTIASNKTGIVLGAMNSTKNNNGYEDYRTAGILARLAREKNGASDGLYNLTVTIYSSVTENVTVTVWIDWDRNGSYDEQEKKVLGTRTVNGEANFSGVILVDSSKPLEDYSMRIIATNQTDASPCGTLPEGEVEDHMVSVFDTEKIMLQEQKHNGSLPEGEQVAINTTIISGTNITSVTAKIYRIEDSSIKQPYTTTLVETLQLYDDGNHNDGAPGDGTYANNWTVPAGIANYSIELVAANIYGGEHSITYYETTQPFPRKGELLVIDEESIEEPNPIVIAYITTALESRGYPYTLYNNESLQLWGVPRDIMNYTAWLFSIPYYSMSYSWIKPEMEKYLDSGGNLLVTGQDIGYTHYGDSFYSEYLHASYVQDDTDIYEICGIDGDPIGDGLCFSIQEGEGADNQYWPSEIDPIPPAATVFKYNESTSGGNTSSLVSTGSAAIRYDNGTYKTVYYAFGLEAVNTTSTRAEIIDRTLQWFLNSSIYRVEVSCPQNNSLTNKTLVELNITASETLKHLEVLAGDGTSLGMWNDTSNVTLSASLGTEGENRLTVRGTDYWDRNRTWTIILDRDTTPPKVSVAQPGNNTITTLREVEIVASVSDKKGIASCGFTINGTSQEGALEQATCKTRIQTTPGESYEVVAWATDIVGNRNESQKIVFKRNSPPVFTVAPPENLSTNDTTTAWFVFSATDPEGHNLTASASIGTLTLLNPGEWNWSWSPTYLDAGNHTLEISMSDTLDGKILDTINTTINITVVHISITGNLSEAEANGTLEVVVEDKTINETTPVDPREYTGTRNVTIVLNRTVVAEFKYNFSVGTLNLSGLRIIVGTNKSKKSMAIVDGIGLEPQNKTKTIYLPVHAGTGLVCIKDVKGASPTDVTPLCQGDNETIVLCNGSLQDGYSCILNESTYVVSGLRHSLVTEQEPYCGDGYCNNGETCSSCSADCGLCPPTQETSKRSGGGGGGGFVYTPPCTPNWTCTEWSECTMEGFQYRNCTDTNNCGTNESKPEEQRECTPVLDLPSEWCGDGECNDNETCTNCPLDCGACPVKNETTQTTSTGTETSKGTHGNRKNTPVILLILAGVGVMVLLLLYRKNYISFALQKNKTWKNNTQNPSSGEHSAQQHPQNTTSHPPTTAYSGQQHTSQQAPAKPSPNGQEKNQEQNTRPAKQY